MGYRDVRANKSRVHTRITDSGSGREQQCGTITIWRTDVLCHHSPRQISLTFGQHPLYLVSDPYICTTALYRPCYHFHPQHSLHPPFASSQHLLTPKPSHPSHVISSFVTGTAIMSARQEARSDSVVSPLLRQAVECGGNQDNGDSKWRQSATRRQ